MLAEGERELMGLTAPTGAFPQTPLSCHRLEARPHLHHPPCSSWGRSLQSYSCLLPGAPRLPRTPGHGPSPGPIPIPVPSPAAPSRGWSRRWCTCG